MSMHSVPVGNSLNCGNCGVAGNPTSQTSCGCFILHPKQVLKLQNLHFMKCGINVVK